MAQQDNDELPVFDQAQIIDAASVADAGDASASGHNFDLQTDILTESSRLDETLDEFLDENLIISSVERGGIKDDTLLYSDESFSLDEQPEFA